MLDIEKKYELAYVVITQSKQILSQVIKLILIRKNWNVTVTYKLKEAPPMQSCQHLHRLALSSLFVTGRIYSKNNQFLSDCSSNQSHTTTVKSK